MWIAVVIAGVAVAAILGFVLARMVKARGNRWERTLIEPDRWKVTNRTGVNAVDVRLEVRGEFIRGIDTGEVGDIAAGASVEFRTTDSSEADGGKPLLIVTWRSNSGRRRLWAAPLRQ